MLKKCSYFSRDQGTYFDTNEKYPIKEPAMVWKNIRVARTKHEIAYNLLCIYGKVYDLCKTSIIGEILDKHSLPSDFQEKS